jgi:hypothetical protein
VLAQKEPNAGACNHRLNWQDFCKARIEKDLNKGGIQIMSSQRAYPTPKDAKEALRARGLYPASKGRNLYVHPRCDRPFYADLDDPALTDRERGIIVEETLEALSYALEAMKERP